jgi:spoIIIJ-associated protein
MAMAPETEKRAASVEEAIEAALAELGVSEQEAQIEVVSDNAAGGEAVVRVRTRIVRTVAAEVDEGLEEQADAAADFLEELLSRMGIDAIAEPNSHSGHMYVDIVDGPEDDMALLIGRHGQTLDAIQELTRMVVGHKLDERVRVIIDVGDYRKREESRLVERAHESAQRVLQSGKEVEFEPMNSFARKMVHDAVAEVAGVESTSRGEEPNRFVVIIRRP